MNRLQYLFIVASLTVLIRWVRSPRRVHAACYVVLATLALITRNSGVLLLPSMLLVVLSRIHRNRWRQATVVLGLPAALWFVWHMVASASKHALLTTSWGPIRPDSIPRQGHVLHNFGDAWLATQSVSAAVVVLAPYCVLLWLAWPELDRAIRSALTTALLVNTVVVWLFTLAWESRLFFLPVLLLVPTVGWQARGALRRAGRPEVWATVFTTWRVLVLGGLLGVSFWVSSFGYPGMTLEGTGLETWPPLVAATLMATGHMTARSLRPPPAGRCVATDPVRGAPLPWRSMEGPQPVAVARAPRSMRVEDPSPVHLP